MHDTLIDKDEYNKIFNQRRGEVSRSECIDGQVYLFCDNYRNIRCLGAYSTPEYRDGNLLRIKSPILFSDGYYDSYVIYILMINHKIYEATPDQINLLNLYKNKT